MEVSARVRDVTEVLGASDERALGAQGEVAIHDPCHLAHAQKVVAEPRALRYHPRDRDSRVAPLRKVNLAVEQRLSRDGTWRALP